MGDKSERGGDGNGGGADSQLDYPDSTNLHHAAVFPILRATLPERYLAPSTWKKFVGEPCAPRSLLFFSSLKLTDLNNCRS